MNQHNKTRNNEEADEAYVTELGYSVEPTVSHLFKVNITSDFEGPDYYTKVFNMLLQAAPTDVVRFIVSSYGGRMDGLQMLLEGIRLTDAHTEVLLVGNAYSCASLLCMAVDEVIVLPHADMLCHAVRFGISGKSQDIVAMTEHTTKGSLKLFEEYYEGFLSQEEIKNVLKGEELYLHADDIVIRLAQREIYFEEKEKAIEADKLSKTEADSDVQPSKRRSTSKKKQ